MVERLRQLQLLEEEEQTQRRPHRTISDRSNPITSFNDDEFLKRFRFSKHGVLYLMEVFDFDTEERGRGPWVPPLLTLCIVLRLFASNSFQAVIADVAQVSQAFVSISVKKISTAICRHRKDFIHMPSNWSEIAEAQQAFKNVAGFPRVIGCIDGTHVRILCPSFRRGELFRCRKNFYSINVQIVSSPFDFISNIVARWPGSTHDSRIFENSSLCADLEARRYGNGLLLGDQGYPCRKYLMTKLLHAQTAAEKRYNSALTTTRTSVERVLGQWKRRFPIVGTILRLKLETSLKVIVATAVLFNLTKLLKEDLPPMDEGVEIWDGEVQQGAPPSSNAFGNAVRQEIIETYFSQSH